ncbi:MAG: proton-conducting transporter membrane subunit [Bacteroidota bacterium]|nr:proton-conducting transporter membrane subunit [Bacteroidota bacterium]MDP4189986.1 proton-conducting transporter membrane subunit [Bacteroidota bacterium]MDP4193418.1 proton-conducting transporter membrane subunit [Bacteroidota bacterium]
MSINLFFWGILIQSLCAIIPLIIKNENRYSFLSHFGALLGIVFSLLGTIGNLVFGSSGLIYIGFNPYWNSLNFRFDSLSTFFVLLIQILSIPALLYSFSYQKPYIASGKKVKLYVFSFIMLIVSLQLLTVANNAVLFLVFWELMALLSYLNMVFENEKSEVQKGSFIYFVATHLATFLLYVFFLMLHQITGSWNFSEFHLVFNSTPQYYLLFALGFIGFGIKAGFMPFHFWLPKAHPIAPTYLSAFLSGVIIKLGIYGIFRVFEFLKPTDPILGWIVLAISLISAIFGVWYALAQHDIKTLLAYHSIENIGIIGIGMGIGLIGMAYSNQTIIILGFAGALFHTVNHAIFKSQLFIGSGIIYQNLHTRNIEKMGGIIHYAPWLSVFFLIGSVAISGIPPLNGFISEFIIYNSFFKTAGYFGNYYPIFMLIMTVGLALVGGLAVACFTKVNSIMFLGLPRTELKAFHVSRLEYFSLGILALMCIFIGIFPQPVIAFIIAVLQGMPIVNSFGNDFSVISSAFPAFSPFTMIFLSLILFMTMTFLFKKFLSRKSRIAKPWGCGYQHLNERMQYTASSYADELNLIPSNILMIKKDAVVPEDIFPKAGGHFHSHSHDFAEEVIVRPVYSKIIKSINRIVFLSKNDIRVYIAFILIALVSYLAFAFFWKF